jgi:uncharacterized protein YbaR (Trm112 family)
MRADQLSRLICPACGGPLTLADGELPSGGVATGPLRSDCGLEFEILDGIPNLVHPGELLPSDEMFKQEYDARAHRYDRDLDWQFDVFKEDKNALRERMVELLELGPGASVIETGAGTGEDSVHILERIGPTGSFVAHDLSKPMLDVAREKLSAFEADVSYVLSNAAYLPFEADSFDAAFHFGGLN